MSPSSPTTHAHLRTRTSPKTSPSDPRLNPFSALSPHLSSIPLEDDQSESNSLQSLKAMMDRRQGQAFSFYAPPRLLGIAKRLGARSGQRPASMLPIEHWFGPLPQARLPNQPFEDPALTLVGSGPAVYSGRRGVQSGYNEGFGMGGNIVQGRGGNRGARNAGLRRNDGYGEGGAAADGRREGSGQTGKVFQRDNGDNGLPRSTVDDQIKQDVSGPRGRRDESDWRRAGNGYMPHAQGGQSRRGPGGVAWTDRLQRHEDEGTEPAWMQDDNATGFDDPAIARFAADDSLVKFKPGEDLIAAGRHPHLDAPAGDKWRRPMDLPAFFAAPANAAPAHGSGPSRPRTFNAADFLKTSKPDSDGEEDEAIKIPRPQSDDQEQSRFHRFFNVPAGVAAADTGGASPNTAPLVEAGRPFSGNRIRVSPQLPDSDRASRLMDLLSLNPNTAPIPSQPHPTTQFLDLQPQRVMASQSRPPGLEFHQSSAGMTTWQQHPSNSMGPESSRPVNPQDRTMLAHQTSIQQRPPALPSQSEMLLQSLHSGMSRSNERRPPPPQHGPDTAQLLAENQAYGLRYVDPVNAPFRPPSGYHYPPQDPHHQFQSSPHDLLQKLRYGEAPGSAFYDQSRSARPPPPGSAGQYSQGYAMPTEMYRPLAPPTTFVRNVNDFPPGPPTNDHYPASPSGPRQPEHLQRELLNSLLGPR